MRPVSRHGENKHYSAGKFRRNVQRTKLPNIRLNPMRGGWRL